MGVLVRSTTAPVVLGAPSTLTRNQALCVPGETGAIG